MDKEIDLVQAIIDEDTELLLILLEREITKPDELVEIAQFDDPDDFGWKGPHLKYACDVITMYAREASAGPIE